LEKLFILRNNFSQIPSEAAGEIQKDEEGEGGGESTGG